MRYFIMAVAVAMTFGACQKLGHSPEAAFTSFSMAVTMAQPEGIDKIAEPEYSRNFQNAYDNIGILSAIWPKNIVIVNQTTADGVVTLNVQGTAVTGKTINGQFKLRQYNDMWKVFEGDWQYRPDPETSPSDPAAP